MSGKGHKLSKRQAARFAAVQALYQIDVTASDPRLTVAEFKSHRLDQLFEPLDMSSPGVDETLFQDIVLGASSKSEELDGDIAPLLAEGWSTARLGYQLRACLRAAAFELHERDDIPPKVVIAEYVGVSQMFGGENQGKMVNAVLDRLARRLKPDYFQT